MKPILTFLSCISLTVFASISAAADSLSARIDAYLVTTAPDGSEALKLAEVANPGDVILYRAIFENQAESALVSVRPVLPIPVGLEYSAGSVSPKPQEGSLDGATFKPFPILDSTGEPVAAGTYRAFRWEVSKLDAGAPFTAELRAKLVQ